MTTIRSMTGFARIEVTTPAGQLAWELRSVNHRYLEATLKLPDGFRAIETDARALLGRTVKRGKLDAGLSLKAAGERELHATLNPSFAAEIVGHANAVAATIGKAGGQAAPIDPVDILRWPGVLQEQETRLETLHPLALETLGRAATELAASRSREGARLQELLESRCAEILLRVAAVRARLPAVLAAIRERLGERVRALVATVDTDRLEQELALIAQKLDVAEELDRLEAHVAEFRTTLARHDEAAGRRLDFLLQEFNREANTLASKSADAETTRHAVDLKVLIEQMREQVQNVE
jgi:uncharacterized protein (TIGR00255 family)